VKEKKFRVFTAASADELDNLWAALLSIDKELLGYNFSAKELSGRLVKFTDHGHYFFDIVKCGEADCDICLQARLAPDVFSTLKHLSDPAPGSDDHYTRPGEPLRPLRPWPD